MRKILLLILSLALVFSLSALLFSCGDEEDPNIQEPCTSHKDEDENGLCDVCGEVTVVIPVTPSEVSVVFTAKDQDGVTGPGVTFTFTEKGKNDATPTVKVSDSDGKLTASVFIVGFADYLIVNAVGNFLELSCLEGGIETN